MKKLKILLLFTSLLLWRSMRIESPLPDGWSAESKIRLSVLVLETPDYQDFRTIVRDGIWEVRIKGYAPIIPGERVEFSGPVQPKIVLNRVTKIVMMDPSWVVVSSPVPHTLGLKARFLIKVDEWRGWWVSILARTLPSPMAELAAGILLGVKGQMPTQFYQQLIRTGTIHIVAASGFNVMVVASVLMSLGQRIWRRSVSIMAGVVGVFVYVMLAGASASVVRAGIMGSLTLIAYYFGRPAEARRILWVTVYAMLLFNPLYIVDVGFQLSVAATAGLLYIEPWMRKLQSFVPCNDLGKQSTELKAQAYGFLVDYLYPTLAATVATMPIILWHFGRLSLISPLVNVLVLPVVPLIMLLSALTLFGGQVVAWITYVPLWWVVGVIRWFGNI